MHHHSRRPHHLRPGNRWRPLEHDRPLLAYGPAHGGRCIDGGSSTHGLLWLLWGRGRADAVEPVLQVLEPLDGGGLGLGGALKVQVGLQEAEGAVEKDEAPGLVVPRAEEAVFLHGNALFDELDGVLRIYHDHVCGA